MKTKSAKRGKDISAVEVTNVSPHGLWLLLDDEELFLTFEQFPWFRAASIAQICSVQRPSPQHLYWPDLDIDLSVESVRNPAAFPLVSRASPQVNGNGHAKTATKKSRRSKIGRK